MFAQLQEINRRPKPFEHDTVLDLWNDPHVSKKMLDYHLDGSVDISSRRMKFIDRSVEFIISRFAVGASIHVADFGCGPGLYTSRLAKSGAIVTGIDFSERSIRYAKEQAECQGLDVHYFEANYLEFETEERFDLITLIMCDFCVLDPARRKGLLEKMQNLLKPGGAVLFDVYSLGAFEKREEQASFGQGLMGGFWSADEYFGFSNTFKYHKEKVVLDKYTIIEESRTRTVYNWLQYFDPVALKAEIEGAGLTLAEKLANVAGDAFDPESDEFAVVATRP